MIIITDRNHINIAKELAIKYEAKAIIANIKQFSDGSLKVKIDHDIQGQDIMILQSITTPVNDNLLQLLLIADAARNMNCGAITAFIPYLAYSRQDKAGENESAAIKLVARMIAASGISKVITIDIHSKTAEGTFEIEVENISAANLFAQYFREKQSHLVISPDLGGGDRAKALARLINADYAVLSKTRNQDGGCYISGVTSNIAGKDCIIIDDIIDSGLTLRKAHEFLTEKGANSVSAAITHAVCSTEALKQIQQLPWQKFYVTNSISREDIPEGVERISIFG